MGLGLLGFSGLLGSHTTSSSLCPSGFIRLENGRKEIMQSYYQLNLFQTPSTVFQKFGDKFILALDLFPFQKYCECHVLTCSRRVWISSLNSDSSRSCSSGRNLPRDSLWSFSRRIIWSSRNFTIILLDWINFSFLRVRSSNWVTFSTRDWRDS